MNRNLQLLLAALALGLTATAAEVRLSGEFGWDGRSIGGTVNPLVLRVENTTGLPLTAELRVRHRAGSEWRGEAIRELVLPLLLAPAGRAVYRLPFPLEPGGRQVEVDVFGSEVDTHIEIPVHLVPGPIVLSIGQVPNRAGGPAPLRVEPDDLPEDPLLLDSVSEVWIGTEVHVGEAAEAALVAWQAYLGGSWNGRAAPVPAWPEALEWINIMREAPLVRVPQGMAALGVAAYLILGGVALTKWTSTGRGGLVCALIMLALGIAGFCAVWWDGQEYIRAYTWTLETDHVHGFAPVWCGLFARQQARLALPGRWVDLPGAEDALVVRDLRWAWGSEGWMTHLALAEGELRILWSLQRRPRDEGPPSSDVRLTVDSEDPPEALPVALAPLWDHARAFGSGRGFAYVTVEHAREQGNVWVHHALYVVRDE